MWRGPTEGFASPRSCGTSGGTASGWSASYCWRWSAGGGRRPAPTPRPTSQPGRSNSRNLPPRSRPFHGGDEREVSLNPDEYLNQDVKANVHRAGLPNNEGELVA